jgi:hypothetical protein
MYPVNSDRTLRKFQEPLSKEAHSKESVSMEPPSREKEIAAGNLQQQDRDRGEALRRATRREQHETADRREHQAAAP